MNTKKYKHHQWCWALNKKTILVSKLSEKQAKDALCECIELIEKIGTLTRQSAELIENAGFVRL